MTIATTKSISVSKSKSNSAVLGDAIGASILKPTEAQLRYAQFHHGRRAQAVKHRIDRLHQTPLEVKAVAIGKITIQRETFEGNGDDGCSSVDTKDTSDVEIKAIRLRRPPISTGRRAFLKDSKRAYRKRRKDIESHGYKGYFTDDDDDDVDVDDDVDIDGDQIEADAGFASEWDNHTDDDDEAEDSNKSKPNNDDENLTQVFRTLPKQQSRRRRKNKGKRGGGSKAASAVSASADDSYQRFQAACHAMMRNIQTSQNKAAPQSIEAPSESKRWKRSKAHVAAAEAQKETDFYRYKTSGWVNNSNKNASLLLSYKYFQQNQTEFKMDRGATWLTHLPAKQSKRSQGNHYYFQNMNDLQHLIQQATSFDENDANNDYENNDGDESVATLAMRKPGPQKFHRLVEYVQHRLIEKEKQQQNRILQHRHLQQQEELLLVEGDGDAIPKTKIGQARTREIAESISIELLSPATNNSTPTRIQQMADSLEGKGGTPKMKLHQSTPFSELSNYSSLSMSRSNSQRIRRMRRKSKYVPRMRLRDFVVEGDNNDNDDSDVPTPLPRKILSERFLPGEIESNDEDGHPNTLDEKEFSSSTSPTMKLRDFTPGIDPQSGNSNRQYQLMSTNRTRELALALESDPNHSAENQNKTREMALALESDHNHSSENNNSKVQQIRKSLEPDRTPKMILKGAFDRIDDHEGGASSSSPTAVSRSSVQRLSKQFQSPPTEEQLEDFNRPSRQVVDEFSKHIDPRIYQQFEQMGQDPKEEFSKHIDPRIYQQFEQMGQYPQQQNQQRQAQNPQNQRYSTSSSSHGNDHTTYGDRRKSSASNVTEFFARIRGEQQQRQHELHQQQQGATANSSSNSNSNSNLPSHSNYPLDTVAHSKSPSEHSDAVSDLSKGSNVSGLWYRGRNSISAMTSNLNTIAENKGKGFLSPQVIGRGKELLSPDIIGKATSGLFSKFRGVPEYYRQEDESDPVSLPNQKLEESVQPQKEASSSHNSALQNHRPQDQEPNIKAAHPLVKNHSIDSHDALRHYRKTRASMSPEASDNISEASSFHALPNQIREVIQHSGGKVSPSAAAAAAAAAAVTAREDGGLPPRFVSPNRSSIMSASQESTMLSSDLSSDQYKRAHGRFVENSTLLGGEFERDTIIDTDDTQSLESDAHNGMDPQVLANLMMSPDMLQKRLKQAIGSVEQQKWDQVLFLINANPWLAEMKELTTNQFLLHKLAFFGTGTTPAPMSLSKQLVEKFPAAVYKFDQDGNVPLHLASAAGNIAMIKMLGDKFSSGASIRNEDGMLPLHFAISSFAGFESAKDSSSRPLETIKMVLKLFPQAIAIADNDGNLPLHVVSECLEGGVGVDVVYLLMDEADRQLEDPYGARFRNKIKLEEMFDDDEEEKSQGDMSTHNRMNAASFIDDDDEDLLCTMVLNEFNETPLLAAIKSNRGWEMIEALVSGPGGRKAALKVDSDKNNALHLLVGEFQDATAAMVSIMLYN